MGRATAAENDDPNKSRALRPGEMLRIASRPSRFEIQTGPRTDTARVYAEPSHTLLGAFLYMDYEASPAGAAFRKKVLKENRMVVARVTRGGIAIIALSNVPPTLADKRITVFATHVWPDGKHEERQVLDLILPAGLASFMATVFEPKSDDLLVACTSPCGASHGRYRRGETFSCCPGAN